MVSGVTLTVVGMSVVFAALTLLALAAWILERVFRAESEKGSLKGASTPEPLEGADDITAVIALALLYHTKRKGSLHIERVDESMWIQQSRVYT
jgi:sodium pump decarboxylase gamma subunit